MRGVIHRIRRTRTPAASHNPTNSSNAPTSPDTTVDDGPFTAATDTRPPHRPTNPTHPLTGNATDTIPPPPANATIARDRNATTRAPSSSDNAPATTAAAISPCECPTTAAGTTPNDTPQLSQRHHHRPQHRLHHIHPIQPRRTLHPTHHIHQRPIHERRQRPPHSTNRAANTGDASNNPTAIPTHCEP